MKPVAALALVLALVGAGCGAKGATIPEARLAALVLQQRDLAAGFSEFVNGPQTRNDLHPGPRKDPARFGRLGGWISRFNRASASIRTRGPLVIESRADLFPSAGAAKKDLHAYEQEYEALPQEVGVARVDAPSIGDEAVAFRFGRGRDRYFVVAWREANSTAAVLVEGSSVALADAVRLARLQQAHLAAAAA